MRPGRVSVTHLVPRTDMHNVTHQATRRTGPRVDHEPYQTPRDGCHNVSPSSAGTSWSSPRRDGGRGGRGGCDQSTMIWQQSPMSYCLTRPCQSREGKQGSPVQIAVRCQSVISGFGLNPLPLALNRGIHRYACHGWQPKTTARMQSVGSRLSAIGE